MLPPPCAPPGPSAAPGDSSIMAEGLGLARAWMAACIPISLASLPRFASALSKITPRVDCGSCLLAAFTSVTWPTSLAPRGITRLPLVSRRSARALAITSWPTLAFLASMPLLNSAPTTVPGASAGDAGAACPADGADCAGAAAQLSSTAASAYVKLLCINVLLEAFTLRCTSLLRCSPVLPNLPKEADAGGQPPARRRPSCRPGVKPGIMEG